jgi:hypothetical protein
MVTLFGSGISKSGNYRLYLIFSKDAATFYPNKVVAFFFIIWVNLRNLWLKTQVSNENYLLSYFLPQTPKGAFGLQLFEIMIDA